MSSRCAVTQEQIDAFCAELTELCKKHGLYVTGWDHPDVKQLGARQAARLAYEGKRIPAGHERIWKVYEFGWPQDERAIRKRHPEDCEIKYVRWLSIRNMNSMDGIEDIII